MPRTAHLNDERPKQLTTITTETNQGENSLATIEPTSQRTQQSRRSWLENRGHSRSEPQQTYNIGMTWQLAYYARLSMFGLRAVECLGTAREEQTSGRRRLQKKQLRQNCYVQTARTRNDREKAQSKNKKPKDTKSRTRTQREPLVLANPTGGRGLEIQSHKTQMQWRVLASDTKNSATSWRAE